MRQILLALLLAVFPAVNAAQADTALIVDGLQRAQETAASRPLRRMSMSAVATKWGEPATKPAAVLVFQIGNKREDLDIAEMVIGRHAGITVVCFRVPDLPREPYHAFFC